MRRKIRDWFLVILFALLGIFFQFRLMAPILKDRLELNLIVGLIIWLGFFKNEPEGALMSFIISYLLGAVSGVWSGVYLFSGMSLYLLTQFLKERFSPLKPGAQLLFSWGLVAFYQIFLLFSAGIFVKKEYLGEMGSGYFFLEIFINGIFSVLVFHLFNQLDNFFDRIPEALETRKA